MYFVFLVFDEDRSGKIERPEFLKFLKQRKSDVGEKYLYATNLANAANLYEQGSWDDLEHVEFMALLLKYDMIMFPVWHLQKLISMYTLGEGFFDKVANIRQQAYEAQKDTEIFSFKESTKEGLEIDVVYPGTFSWSEILNFLDRRATRVSQGFTRRKKTWKTEKEKSKRIENWP